MPNPSLGNLTDERHLREVLDDLQRRTTKIESNTVPFGTNQRGALPGYMRAVQINDAAQKSTMWIKLDGNQPGISPYQAVTDSAGTIRVELGNLAANGVSAAHYGWRVNDASGVPIADAIGLSQVMKQLGRGDNSAGQNFTTTTPTVFSSVTVTFSLVRAVRVLTLCQAAAFDAQQTGEMDVFVDGVNTVTPGNNTSGSMQWGITGPTVTSMTFYSATLAAGSHTIDLRGFVNATPATLSGLG